MDLNKIIQRARAVLVTPRTEWPVIAAEPTTVQDLYREYIMILAAIPPVAQFVKVSILGYAWHGFRVYRLGMGPGLTAAIVQYVASLAAVYLLAIIVGNLDLLECLLGDNQIALNQVRASQRAATRGADLTRRLLTFARMEALKPASVSLNASIQTTVSLATRTLGPEIAITTALDDSLPHVFVDSSGLESALLNLMVNARDAMPGGGAITVATHLVNLDVTYPPVQTNELNPGWYACVSVSDNGHGMTKEVRERAFEPFFTTKPRDKGTGLGLAMIYGFVKQSGGLVRIYSEPGLGTTVNMYLPLVQPTLEPEVIPDELVWSAPPGLTVLVVDDEPDLLTIALAYLAEIGCRGLTATDGATALDILQCEPQIGLIEALLGSINSHHPVAAERPIRLGKT